MNLGNTLTGSVEVELTSADLPLTLNAISEASVEIIRLQWVDELSCRFTVRRKQFRQLKKIADKRGDSFRILRKTGAYWQGKEVLKRPLLILGLLFFLMLTMVLPGRVLFVKVEGNEKLSDRQILSAAENYGVYFGASCREIRSERVKNGVLSEVPGIQWVGVNTSGCVATISVRERSEGKEETAPVQVSRIVADRDGYILSGTAVRGTPMFQPGQTVRQGQVLISGYTDCGLCIRAGRAEGEIMAQTKREIKAVTPGNHLARIRKTETKRKYSLLFRKKRINLWKDSGISDVTCGRMYEEYYVTLPGGFRLPFALCVETLTYWETEPGKTGQGEVQASMQAFAQRYLQSQMIAGTVRESEEVLRVENGLFVLDGSYVCEEMIGREQPEQIGEANGKNS